MVDLLAIYVSLPRPAKYKVGLFIFACCSYLCRQAMQRETNRLKTAGLKLRMYSFAPPPLFFKFREVYHLVTRLLLINNISHFSYHNNTAFCNFKSWKVYFRLCPAKFKTAANKSRQRQPLFYTTIYCCLKFPSLRSFLDRNCNRNSHTNHRVVTCADQTHHLNVSRYG